MKRAWLVRAGRHGEQESLALEQGLAVVGWWELQDLSQHATRESLMEALRDAFPDESPTTLRDHETAFSPGPQYAGRAQWYVLTVMSGCAAL